MDAFLAARAGEVADLARSWNPPGEDLELEFRRDMGARAGVKARQTDQARALGRSLAAISNLTAHPRGFTEDEAEAYAEGFAEARAYLQASLPADEWRMLQQSNITAAELDLILSDRYG